MTRSQKSFLLKTAHALGACQLVEFELKIYITQAFELCRKRVGGTLPFTMTGNDYENTPLGPLVAQFRKLSDCPRLVKRLESFSKERNFLAHKAISDCMDPDGGFQPGKAKAMTLRLEKIKQEAFALVDEINNESRKWLPRLYFDPISD